MTVAWVALGMTSPVRTTHKAHRDKDVTKGRKGNTVYTYQSRLRL